MRNGIRVEGQNRLLPRRDLQPLRVFGNDATFLKAGRGAGDAVRQYVGLGHAVAQRHLFKRGGHFRQQFRLAQWPFRLQHHPRDQRYGQHGHGLRDPVHQHL